MPTHESLPTANKPFGADYDPSKILGLTDIHDQAMRSWLRPYQDETFLVRRLSEEGRILRGNTEVVADLIEGLEGNDDASILKAVASLNEARIAKKPTSKSPAVALIDYATLAHNIAYQKNLISETAPTDRANAIALLVGREIAREVPDEEVPAFLIGSAYLGKRVGSLQAPRALVTDDFIHGKMFTLASLFQDRVNGIAFARTIPSQDIQPTSPDRYSHDTDIATRYFTELRAQQHYGVKLGYRRYEEGGTVIFAPPRDQEIYDRVEHRPNLHPITRPAPMALEVDFSRHTSLQRLKPPESKERSITLYNYQALGVTMILRVDQRGELFVDAHGYHPLGEIMAKEGKYEAYRQLQARIFADYFDMTQPAEITHRATRMVESERNSWVGTTQPTASDAMRRLVLPRLHVLHEHIQGAQQVELEPIDHARSIREHDVTWHIRKLQPGWSASPEAVQLAKEKGVILADDETFVRDHKRGNTELGKIVGHHLIERSESN